jgi:hypothetical protein
MRWALICCGVWLGMSAVALADSPALAQGQALGAATPAGTGQDVPAPAPIYPGQEVPNSAPEVAPHAALAQPAQAAQAAPPTAAARAANPPERRPIGREASRRADGEDEAAPGFFVRLALGVQVALLTTGDVSQLRTPTSFQLDFGYGFTPSFALNLRLGSWLSYSPFALHFVGVGVRQGFLPEGMFVIALAGLSLRDVELGVQGGSDESVQGLALQLDLGQRWPLSASLAFEVGAHFECGSCVARPLRDSCSSRYARAPAGSACFRTVRPHRADRCRLPGVRPVGPCAAAASAAARAGRRRRSGLRRARAPCAPPGSRAGAHCQASRT